MAAIHRLVPPRVVPPARPLRGLAFLLGYVRNPIGVVPQAAYEEDLVAYTQGHREIAWITAPALIRQVLLDEREKFLKLAQIRLLSPLLGKGILTSEGADWKWQRQAAAPMFRQQDLLGFVPAFVRATETLLAKQVPHYIIGRIGRGPGGIRVFDKNALKEYIRAFRDPRCIHATCEDYRAAASIDLVHDKKDLKRKIRMPVLVLWGKKGVIVAMFKPLQDWCAVASDVRGRALDCGHFLPEEKPDDVLRELRRFLGGTES